MTDGRTKLWLRLPRSGYQAEFEQIRGTGLAATFVFLMHSEDEFLQACLEEGALGYVT